MRILQAESINPGENTTQGAMSTQTQNENPTLSELRKT